MASLGGCSKYVLPGILFYMGLSGFVTRSSSSGMFLCALGITCKGGVGDTAHLAITIPLSESLQCRHTIFCSDPIPVRVDCSYCYDVLTWGQCHSALAVHLEILLLNNHVLGEGCVTTMNMYITIRPPSSFMWN